MEIVGKIPYVRLRTTKRVFDKKHYTRKVSSSIRCYGTTARKSSLEKIRSALTNANKVLKTDLLRLTKFTINTTKQIFPKNTADQVRTGTGRSGFFQPHQALVLHLRLNSKVEKSIEKSSLMKKFPLSAAIIPANETPWKNIKGALEIANTSTIDFNQIDPNKLIVATLLSNGSNENKKLKKNSENNFTQKKLAAAISEKQFPNSLLITKIVHSDRNGINFFRLPLNFDTDIYNLPIASLALLVQMPDVRIVLKNYVKSKAYKLNSVIWKNVAVRGIFNSITNRMSVLKVKDTNNTNNFKDTPVNFNIESKVELRERFFKNIKTVVAGKLSSATLQKCCLHPNVSQRMYSTTSKNSCNGNKSNSTKKNRKNIGTNKRISKKRHSNMKHHKAFLKEKKKGNKRDSNKSYCGGEYSGAENNNSKIDFCSGFKQISAGKNQHDKNYSHDDTCAVKKDSKMDCSDSDEKCDKNHSNDFKAFKKSARRKDSKIDCSEFDKDEGRSHKKYCEQQLKEHRNAGRKGSGKRDSKIDCSEFHKNKGRVHNKHDKKHSKDYHDAGRKDIEIDCSEFNEDHRLAHKNVGAHAGKNDSKIDCSEFLKGEGRAHKKYDRHVAGRKGSKTDCSEFLKDEKRAHKKYGKHHLKDHHDSGRKGVIRKNAKIDCSEFLQDGQARKIHDKKYLKNSDFQKCKSVGGKNDRLTQTIQITLPKEVKIEIKTSQVDKDNLK